MGKTASACWSDLSLRPGFANYQLCDVVLSLSHDFF